MSIKISIKYEPGSLNFPERSIGLDETETLIVTRSSKKERSNYNNAIFESRVSNFNLYANYNVHFVFSGFVQTTCCNKL